VPAAPKGLKHGASPQSQFVECKGLARHISAEALPLTTSVNAQDDSFVSGRGEFRGVAVVTMPVSCVVLHEQGRG
jgi:hypothetical protein